MARRRQADARQRYVYMLRHSINGRVYIGQTFDLHKRYAQHRRNPVSRMAADAAATTDFDSTFVMTQLAGPMCRLRANHCEKVYIRLYDATGAAGYNYVAAAPASTRRFWYLFRSGRLGRRNSI